MATTDSDLFALAERRLAWVDQRQDVLAANIANADTPGWQAKDLKPFAAVLAGAGAAVPLAVTNPKHLTGHQGSGVATTVAAGERAPDGNAVALDAELGKVADNQATQALVTNLYGKYLSLFNTALGR
jgi:flagellar basal-body rod protein FlgB